MSIEALVQEFDGHVPEWSDYDHQKRSRIDAGLEGAPDEIADKVRSAILETEHVALARRFRDFALAHIQPSYFRETADVQGPLSRPDLALALQRAYAMRSAYVHRLQEIPPPSRRNAGLP